MYFLDKIIDKRIAEYQSNLLATHYAEVENMYRQIRGWRHDYRNHIQVLKSYAAMEDLTSLNRYLEELDTDLNTVDMVLKTGNAMTDVILNSKISLAKSKKIPVTADAHVPVALTTSEIDLCIIIGNLFDNAIEACMALPEEERMIRVYMDMKNTQLYMSFTNTTALKKQKKKTEDFLPPRVQDMVMDWFALIRLSNAVMDISAETVKTALLPPKSCCRSENCSSVLPQENPTLYISSPRTHISSPLFTYGGFPCYTVI